MINVDFSEEGLRQNLINSGVPDHIHEGLLWYMLEGRHVGSFLEAVLSNDLMGALNHADDINRDKLLNICKFLYNNCPNTSWGSAKIYKTWCKYKGLSGLNKTAMNAQSGNS